MITPLVTLYQGYTFRSRLEARYATFFDALDLPWLYEYQGFNVDGTWYLPDFYFPTLDTYGEVKPTTFTEKEFALAAACHCLCFDGMPEAKLYSNGEPCGQYPETAYECYKAGHRYYRVQLWPTIQRQRLWYCFGEALEGGSELDWAAMQAKSARFGRHH
jgi:hypothetical protein